MSVNSMCSMMIMIFTPIIFLCMEDPARNKQKYVLHENVYVYSIYLVIVRVREDVLIYYKAWPHVILSF